LELGLGFGLEKSVAVVIGVRVGARVRVTVQGLGVTLQLGFRVRGRVRAKWLGAVRSSWCGAPSRCHPLHMQATTFAFSGSFVHASNSSFEVAKPCSLSVLGLQDWARRRADLARFPCIAMFPCIPGDVRC